jgi:hypothetical protein
LIFCLQFALNPKQNVILSAVKFQVLTNGIEVKLQRNALSVIEPPTGNEEDDKFDCENMQWNSSDMGKILGCYFFFHFSHHPVST